MGCKFSFFLTFFTLFSGSMISCTAQNNTAEAAATLSASAPKTLLTGAERLADYLPLLEGKKVALLVNQTSVIPDASDSLIPLPDTLIDLGVDVRFLMTPEHGLKGKASAGDAVGDTNYEKKQSIPVYSLYGKNKKPQREWLDSVDCVVFDVQDVGCRFYTYLSTLFYVLEACSESSTDVILLDRPNPNDTIDGPVLDPKFQSFVGMVPVPLLHGCTLGELAQMMLGEGWVKTSQPQNLTTSKPHTLKTSQPHTLTVIPCQGWKHGDAWSLRVAPSPNLRTDHAIRIYPSLCLFEATDISVGRGTDWPFEVLGHPLMKGDFTFTPKNRESASHPLQQDKLCHGLDLRSTVVDKGFHLQWLLACHRQFKTTAQPTCWIKQNTFFDRLAGTDQLRLQIASGLSESAIRDSWQKSLSSYRTIRAKYLLYPDYDN